MRYKSYKKILMVTAGTLLSFSVTSTALAKNFTIFNATNVNVPYFSVNGTTGYVGLGITNPSTLLQLTNNNWISALNAAGTGAVNMFKVNTSNQIEVGAPLNIGSFEFSPDSGLVTFADMPVTSSAAAGTPESYVFKVDGDNIMAVYSESNGSGGIQNSRVGIGKTNPGATLDVAGSGTFSGTVNGTGLCIGGDCKTSWAAIGSASSGWTQNGNEVYKTATAGNVGIGTTAPNNYAGYTNLQISNASTGALLQVSTSTVNGGQFIYDGNGIAISNITGGTATKVKINSGPAAGTGNADLMIDTSHNVSINNGKVGIGTTAPGSYLTIVNDTANTWAHVNGGNSNAMPWLASLDNVVVSSALHGWSFYNNATNGNLDLYRQNASVTKVQVISFERSTGNVGVGKTNPGAGLDVSGAINAGSTVNGIGLCIGGDCKTSWAAVGSASSGWSQNGNEVYKTNTAGNVGIGVTNPTAPLVVHQAGNNVQMKIGREAGQDFSIGRNYNSGVLEIQGNQSGYYNIALAPTNGNVGIGTTAPGNKLDVSGGVGTTDLRFPQTGYITYNVLNSGTQSLIFRNYGTESMRIDGAGNIGIGITNPGYKLQVNGTTHVGVAGSLAGDITGVLQIGGTGTYYMTQIKAINTTSNPGILRTRMGFFTLSGTGETAADATEKMSILADTGNVGVGKTNPGANLDVSGAINAGSTVNGIGLCIGGDCKTSWAAVGSASSGWSQNGNEVYKTNTAGNIGLGITAPGFKLDVLSGVTDVARFKGTGSWSNVIVDSPNGLARFQYNVNNTDRAGNAYSSTIPLAGSAIFDMGNTAGALIFANNTTQPIAFINNATEAMRVQNGNVGIGTTNPVFKLQVGGYGVVNSQLWGAASWSQSGLIAFSAATVNNSDIVSVAFHTDTSAAGSYLRLDAGSAIAFTGVAIHSGAPTSANQSQWNVQYSDDAVTWYNAYAGVDLTRNRGGWTQATWRIDNAAQAHRYWQLYKTNAAVGGDYVREVQFFSAVPEPNLVRTDAAGNVGIGKTNPSVGLDVSGAISAGSTVNGTGLCIGGDCKTSWAAVGSASSGWSQNGNEVYKTNTAGNIGIGTTAPVSKLQLVGGALSVGDTIQVYGHSTFPNVGPSVEIGYYPAGAFGFIQGYNRGGSYVPLKLSGSYLWFDVAGSEKLRIDSTGNVGIGVAAPTAKLDVNGRTFLRGDSYQLMIGGVTSSADYFVLRSGNAATTPAMPDDRLVWFQHNRISATNFRENFWLKDDGGSTQVSPLTLSYNTGVGNVGVGTTNPLNKLSVSGDIGIIGANKLILASDLNSPSYIKGRWIDNNNSGIDFHIFNASVDTTSLSLRETGNVGINKTAPAATLDVVGNGSFSSTVAGTGVCIGASCLTTWPWLRSTTNTYFNDTGNVGIGITNPTAKLHIVGGLILNRTAVGNADYTALATDYIIAFTSLTANRTLTLPNALCTAGRVFLISNETNSAYSVSVDPEGATLIVGMTNILLPAYNTTPVYCNGTNWYMY